MIGMYQSDPRVEGFEETPHWTVCVKAENSQSDRPAKYSINAGLFDDVKKKAGNVICLNNSLVSKPTNFIITHLNHIVSFVTCRKRQIQFRLFLRGQNVGLIFIQRSLKKEKSTRFSHSKTWTCLQFPCTILLDIPHSMIT